MTDPQLKTAIEWTRAHPQTRGCDLVKNAGPMGRSIFQGQECPICLFLEGYDEEQKEENRCKCSPPPTTQLMSLPPRCPDCKKMCG